MSVEGKVVKGKELTIDTIYNLSLADNTICCIYVLDTMNWHINMYNHKFLSVENLWRNEDLM